jgi:hypothetical protein
MAFVRVLHCLAFGTPDSIGVDPSMKYDPTTGELIDVYVEDAPEPSQQAVRRSFEPVYLLHNAAQRTSRATRVWLQGGR